MNDWWELLQYRLDIPPLLNRTNIMKRTRKIDILCAGELLVDFLSQDFAETLDETVNFIRQIGGSPANLCMNMARLGNATKLVASVGKDDMGAYLHRFVENLGVDCSQLAHVDYPTTLILVTRTKWVANFEAYRAADCHILPNQLPAAVLKECSIFHTTCFALSKKPSQLTLMKAARRAASFGCQLSIDANYAQKIWRDREEAQRLVKEYCALGALVKVSEVDWERLYEERLTDPSKAAKHFLNLGASLVCVTLGSEGCLVANTSESHFLPSRKVEVKDTTGAGDAFWSGFLSAWLDGMEPMNCAKAGRRMAELKIGTFGVLPDKVDKLEIYE
jgi:fructokinase